MLRTHEKGPVKRRVLVVEFYSEHVCSERLQKGEQIGDLLPPEPQLLGRKHQ